MGEGYPGKIPDNEYVRARDAADGEQLKASNRRENLIRSEEPTDESSPEVQYRKGLEKKSANVAWRAEGLSEILEKNNDPRSADVRRAIMEIFTTLSKPTQYFEAGQLEDVMQYLEKICDEYNYDSGKRKF